MGATDICFEAERFFLPGAVLQSESLTRLSIKDCRMQCVKVNCSTLKYLYLYDVVLEGDLFRDIISGCPFIEGLELHQCKCVLNKRATPLNLSSKGFELQKLKTLLLDKVKICNLFFSDFSSRFPCLKDLSVHNCLCLKNIQIYSQSHVFISFVNSRVNFKANFDVPNLRKFCFSGKSLLPSVSFQNSCNWESDVSFSSFRELGAKWFLNLNKLLKDLSLSKVSLNLKRYNLMGNIDKARNTLCLPRPLVENLTIDVQTPDYAALLDSLIQRCRPVFVTQDFSYYSSSSVGGKTRIKFLEIVYKILMQQRKSVDDLEEVSVVVFDEVVSVWQTIPWKSLLDTSTSRVAEMRIRSHLRWAQR